MGHTQRFVALSLALVLFACAGEPTPPEHAATPAAQALIGGFTRAQICKAVVALVGGEQIWRITARDAGTAAYVTYDSSHSGRLVQRRCKLEGDRAFWTFDLPGQPSGWLEGSAHGVMTFTTLQSGALFLSHRFDDGTIYEQSFSPRELR